MIIIRSNHDLQTSYLYYYTNPIINFANKKGYKVIVLETEKEISEINLRKRIKTKKPKFIFFNGHGTASALLGVKKEIFVDTNSADIFNGTITFVRACDSLRLLGEQAVKKGCLSFIGYKNKFIIARQHNKTCKPEIDPIAKPALECSNLVMIELLKGRNVKEAIESSHNAASDNILDLVYSNEPWAGASLQALVYNDAFLDFKGDAEAKF